MTGRLSFYHYWNIKLIFSRSRANCIRSQFRYIARQSEFTASPLWLSNRWFLTQLWFVRPRRFICRAAQMKCDSVANFDVFVRSSARNVFTPFSVIVVNVDLHACATRQFGEIKIRFRDTIIAGLVILDLSIVLSRTTSFTFHSEYCGNHISWTAAISINF